MKVTDLLRGLSAGQSVDGETGEVTEVAALMGRQGSAAEQAAASVVKARGLAPGEAVPREPPPAGSLQAALAGLVHRDMLASQKYQEQQWRANRVGAHPAILDFEDWFQAKLRKAGIPMFAHTVVRTFQEQMNEFVQGDSRDSPSDGLWPHNGTAIDLIHSTRAWQLDPQEWLLIGHLGKEVAAQHGLKLVWGGDWRKRPTDVIGWDPAHWEVANWRDVAFEAPWDAPPKGASMAFVRQFRAKQRADMKKRFGG